MFAMKKLITGEHVERNVLDIFHDLGYDVIRSSEEDYLPGILGSTLATININRLNSDSLRDSLLPKLMSGKIRVPVEAGTNR